MIICDFCKMVSTEEDREKSERVFRTDIKVSGNSTIFFVRGFDLCGPCRNALATNIADAIQTTKETRKEANRGTAP